MPPWVQNLCFTAIGAAIGIGADEVKRWLSRRSELRLAKREIYDELAAYIADLEQIWGDKRDFSHYKRVRQVPPQLDIIGWYTSNRFDLLLRLDERKGLRKLHRDIKADVDQSELLKGIPGQQKLLTAVNEGEYDIDLTYLQKRVALILKDSKGAVAKKNDL